MTWPRSVRHHVRPHEYDARRGERRSGCSRARQAAAARSPRASSTSASAASASTRKEIFWLEDEAYIADIERLGFQAAVLADLQVHHTGGPYYSVESKEKDEFWKRWEAMRARREAVKRVLIRIPGVRRLNARFNWFVAPS